MAFTKVGHPHHLMALLCRAVSWLRWQHFKLWYYIRKLCLIKFSKCLLNTSFLYIFSMLSCPATQLPPQITLTYSLFYKATFKITFVKKVLFWKVVCHIFDTMNIITKQHYHIWSDSVHNCHSLTKYGIVVSKIHSLDQKYAIFYSSFKWICVNLLRHLNY